MKPIKLLILLSCIVILLNSNFLAQQTGGSVNGILTDFAGAIVPGAVITIKSKSQTAETDFGEYLKTTTSNNEGEYNFRNVPLGIYEISIAPYGGMSHKSETISILANQSTKLNLELSYGGDCENSSEETIGLSENDKAEIVNQILEDSLIKKHISDYNLLTKQKGAIILSTENIKSEWIKPIKNVNFKLMKQGEIQDIADNKGDFLYLSFDEFKVKGGCVIVTFTNSWAVGKKSKTGYLSGGGSIYQYHKEAGKLVGNSIGGWIS